MSKNNNIEIIPANPPVGGTLKAHQRLIENTTTFLRDRQVTKAVIPPAPVGIRVEPEKPAPRRHFVNPAAIGGRSRRRD